MVSRSGGWMSAIRPHSKRDRSRSSSDGNLVRRAVAADDDLLLRVVERVEGVEELGLRAFLAGEELDVVDEQHVDAAVALAEIEDAVVAHRVDHLVHEPLGRDVGQLQVAQVVQHVVPDRVHQVRLAEPHAAVDEQRVVRARRRFGDGAAGGVRELVRGSDDEGVEGVAGRRGCPVCAASTGSVGSAGSGGSGSGIGSSGAPRSPSSVTNEQLAALAVDLGSASSRTAA